jgi:hypothetical protein
MKRLAFALLLVLIWTIPSFASERFSIVIKNDTEYHLNVFINWVDHPWRDKWPGPTPVLGGEMEPGKLWILDNPRPHGVYIIRWSCRPWNCGVEKFDQVFMMKTNELIGSVIIKPNEVDLVESQDI